MVLPAPLVPLDEVALIDSAAVDLGLDIAELMERAGTALADEATAMAPSGRILVATGPGNNGGDGWVAARLLAERGREVALWPVREPKSELCRQQADAAPPGIEILAGPPTQAPALIVDAILGAGVSGPLRAWAAEAVRALTALDAPVLAADAPTGIGSDHPLIATRTLCFQVAKAELLDDPDGGEFKTVDIGIPPAAWRFLLVAGSCESARKRQPPAQNVLLAGRRGSEVAERFLLAVGPRLAQRIEDEGHSLDAPCYESPESRGVLSRASAELMMIWVCSPARPSTLSRFLR